MPPLTMPVAWVMQNGKDLRGGPGPSSCSLLTAPMFTEGPASPEKQTYTWPLAEALPALKTMLERWGPMAIVPNRANITAIDCAFAGIGSDVYQLPANQSIHSINAVDQHILRATEANRDAPEYVESYLRHAAEARQREQQTARELESETTAANAAMLALFRAREADDVAAPSRARRSRSVATTVSARKRRATLSVAPDTDVSHGVAR